MNVFVWFGTVIVVLGRLVIEPRLDLPTFEGSYEAIAHLFVGWLLGAWWVGRQWRKKNRWHPEANETAMFGWIVIALTGFEIAMFAWQKWGG